MVIRLENCTSVGNGGDGVRIEGIKDVEISGLVTAENGGEGLNIIESPEIDPIQNSAANPSDNKPPPAEERKSISLTKIAERVIGGFILACLVYVAATYLGIHLSPQ